MRLLRDWGRAGGDDLLRGFRLGRVRDLERVRGFRGFDSAANARRRLAAQLRLVAWRLRAMPRASAGTFSVMTDPSATYAPCPILTGATSATLLPIKTRSPMVVGFLCIPS